MNAELKQHIKDLRDYQNDEDLLGEKLIYLGKIAVLSKDERCVLAKEIEPLLYSKNAIIREDAMKVLLNYWRLKKYETIALSFFHDDKENDDIRECALSGYGALYFKKNDKDVMQFMYNILMNKKYPTLMRKTAYSEIFYVSSLTAPNYPYLFFDYDNIDSEMDVELIEKLIFDTN